MDISHTINTLRRHLTLNNGVLAVAAVVVVASIWNTMLTLQRNFVLQQKVNNIEQQIKLTQLEVDTLRLQQQYLNSAEYQELTARAKLGKAAPGETVINLPALPVDDRERPKSVQTLDESSNLQKWMRFFFGR